MQVEKSFFNSIVNLIFTSSSVVTISETIVAGNFGNFLGNNVLGSSAALYLNSVALIETVQKTIFQGSINCAAKSGLLVFSLKDVDVLSFDFSVEKSYFIENVIFDKVHYKDATNQLYFQFTGLTATNLAT